jgi:D-amino-acid oxidase
MHAATSGACFSAGRLQPHLLVIGAGVSGLTSALCLARRGFGVTVLADRFAPHVTSVVAGALWEWPPAVCGQPLDSLSLARSKTWAAESYKVFSSLAKVRDTGVSLRTANSYFHFPPAPGSLEHAKLSELPGVVREFRHDARLIQENSVNPALELRDAYCCLSPIIDTDTYLKWLMDEARRGGVRFVERRVEGLLQETERSLRRGFGAAALVNCTGLGARELGDSSVYPLRGALVRLRTGGRNIPATTQSHCLAPNRTDPGSPFVFIVPRGPDTLVLGGLAEADQWDVRISLDSHDPIRAMYERCLEFLPALRALEMDPIEPLRVGLRPCRPQNVRLEYEAGTRIIHNYGHGGSGVTLSWGCAREVADLAETLLVGRRTSHLIAAHPRG